MSDRPVKIALAVSLAVNVFVIGAVVGAIYMHMHAGGPSRMGNPLLRASEALRPDDRTAFRQMLRAQIPLVRPIQTDAREARREAMTALEAASFDRAAVGALIARARADDEKTREVLEDAVLDFVAKLPADERAAMVDAMRRDAAKRWMLHHPAGSGAPPAS
jgi:uncharacterized membrane protein